MQQARNLAHFEDNLNWEEKAKLNPLYAIMSHKEFENAQSEPTAEQLNVFYQKGVRIWNIHFRGYFETLPENSKVLEYGCGMGRLLHRPAQAGAQCYGIDISQTQLELARTYMPSQENADFRAIGESGNIPLENDTVDYAYSYAVLQHIKKRANLFFAINEIVRVLKPGGLLKIHLPYRNNYFDDRYKKFNNWTFEEKSILFYLHKKYFFLPRIRLIAHNHWGGAAYYVPLNQFLSMLEKKTKILSIEYTEDGGTFISAKKK